MCRVNRSSILKGYRSYLASRKEYAIDCCVAIAFAVGAPPLTGMVEELPWGICQIPARVCNSRGIVSTDQAELYDRDPALISMLSAQPLENPFRRVLLFRRPTLILLQNPLDDPDKRVELGSRRRPAPSITRRYRERQHLRHRPRVDPKAPCCFPLTDSLYVNRSSYLRV